MNRRDFLKYCSVSGFSALLGTESVKAEISEEKSKSIFEDDGTIVLHAHQDDDILWFLPFLEESKEIVLSVLPATYAHLHVVNNHPDWYQQKWVPAWGTACVDDFFNFYIDKKKRQKNYSGKGKFLPGITEKNITGKICDLIADNEVKRIVTHNCWGEYGHIHHRLLNKTIRKIAAECGKDVWMPAFFSDVDTCAAKPTSDFGLESIEVYFDVNKFNELREIYTKEDEKILQSSIHQKYPDFHTWTGGPENGAPEGTQRFLKIVDAGVDKYNKEITEFEKQIPIYGLR
jgi:hypothetical protein